MLRERLIKIIKENYNAPALYVNDKLYSYKDLAENARKIATLVDSKIERKPIAIIADRTLCYYSSVIYCLLSETCFIPINYKLPNERIAKIIKNSNVKNIIIDSRYLDKKNELMHLLEDVNFQYFDESEIYCLSDYSVKNHNLSYVMFTSGSTGEPKGVPISVGNVESYVNYMCDYLKINNQDRVTQLFNCSFDLSIHDMLITWMSGASLYVVPESSLISPAFFIKKHQITVWFSVPSTIVTMSKFKLLKDNAFHSIRMSLFCGEPLYLSTVREWKKACPNSRCINLYGPTEATIACSLYEIENFNDDYVENSIIPLGKPFPHMKFKIDENQELLISGPQLFSGYLNNQLKTKQVLQNENSIIWYKSGDIVNQIKDENFIYIRRTDDQVKLYGYRIELSEIEIASRNIENITQAKAIAFPLEKPQKIVLFLESIECIDQKEVIDHLNSKLPYYMIPKEIVIMNEFPINLSGKIDKHKIIEKWCRDDS